MTLPIMEEIELKDDTCASTEKPVQRNVTTSTDRLYDWDEYTQGLILSSYFWSYMVSQFPFALLSERYGGKHFLGLSIAVPAALTFFTPLCISFGDSTALVVLRVLMGLVSGATYPAVSVMLPRWTTPDERTSLGSIVYAGGLMGTVCGTTFSALIIRYSGLSWPGVFYIFGAMGMAWFPLWCLLCYNSPKQHPFISDEERKYLEENSERKRKPPPAPWRHILTSSQTWAFVIGMIGLDCTFFTMTTDLPKYMSSVVRFSIEDNGYLSALPYLCGWLFSMVCYRLVDQILERRWLGLAMVRKLLATVGLVGPTIFILAASYAGCNKTLVVIMFVAGMTLMGAAFPSVVVNFLDLSPNYSGTIMSIGNGLAAAGGIVMPYIIGVLTPNQTLGEWRLVFWLVFVVALTCCVYFLIYGSVEVQPWDDPDFLIAEKKKAKVTKGKKDKSDSVSSNL